MDCTSHAMADMAVQIGTGRACAASVGCPCVAIDVVVTEVLMVAKMRGPSSRGLMPAIARGRCPDGLQRQAKQYQNQ